MDEANYWKTPMQCEANDKKASYVMEGFSNSLHGVSEYGELKIKVDGEGVRCNDGELKRIDDNTAAISIEYILLTACFRCY